jgi:cell shape-determining protein MreC
MPIFEGANSSKTNQVDNDELKRILAEARQLQLPRGNLYRNQAFKKNCNHNNNPHEGYPMLSLKQQLQIPEVSECRNSPY